MYTEALEYMVVHCCFPQLIFDFRDLWISVSCFLFPQISDDIWELFFVSIELFLSAAS